MSDMLRLNFLIIFDDTATPKPETSTYTDIFTVEIAKATKLGDLKHAIRGQVRHVVNSHILNFWKVSIPADVSLHKNLKHLNLAHEHPSSPVVRLVEIFPDGVKEGCLHIVACPSPAYREMRNITSTEPTSIIEVIDQRIERELESWFDNQPGLDLQANLRTRVASLSPRGPDRGPDELIVLYLHRVLRYPVPFSAVFNFHGTVPQWAEEMTCIVGTVDDTAESVDVLGEAPQNPGLGVVQYAANIEDVIKWVEGTDTMPAVLVPGILFGPDIMVRCRNALLIGQFKCKTESNKESLDAQTNSHALTTLHQDHWFKKSPPHLRQRLIHAIERHRVLRFVGGYPLPPNLGLGTSSLTNAIAALGADVALATINIDTFRAHFIAEDQVSVLEQMEHALAEKRKQMRWIAEIENKNTSMHSLSY